MILAFLAFLLTATLLVGVTSSAEYDPWMDVNDDGIIDIVDIVNLAIRFGEEGTPINKTELLLDLLERVPRSGNISVAAGAFVPFTTIYDFRNLGYYLANRDASANAYFYASVQLPHGATVTNFTIYWKDGGTDYVSCFLYRNNLTSGNEAMASAASPTPEAPGTGSSYDDTIDYATVDNNKYAYWLALKVPPSASHLDYFFYSTVIEYEYP